MRPKLLDLFCGAGGAAMGYYRAGFDVVGIDIEPQPHYPFTFIQGDALNPPVNLDKFDAIHASPPCQGYSVANNIWQYEHPKLIPQVKELIGKAPFWVIENVPGAPLSGITLCGLSFGINVKRHRLFESNILMLAPPCGSHDGDWLLVFGHTVLERGHVIRKTPAGNNTTRRRHVGTDLGRAAMGIDWMNRDELSEAIPPAYTEFIGKQLMAYLT